MDGRGATDSDLDGAVFAPARLVGPRRPPVLAAGVALVVGSLVAVGLAGPSGGGAGPAGEPVIGAGAAVGESASSSTPDLRTRPPRGGGPMPSVDPQLLRLELHPDEGDLFVHGEVFSGEVTVVVVSLEDARGRLDTKSARIATGSTAFRIGANARFDVRFEIPDLSRDEGLWVRANAYDEDGTPVASSRQAISTTVAGG